MTDDDSSSSSSDEDDRENYDDNASENNDGSDDESSAEGSEKYAERLATLDEMRKDLDALVAADQSKNC